MELLLMLQLHTALLCDSLIVPNCRCYEVVLECAYDEGDAKWCFEDYLRGDSYEDNE